MKKILLIIYYWPPSGGSGVQRWVKFAKYLPQFGWMPTVITTRDGDYPVLDQSLLKEIPANIKIIRTKTPVFNKLFRKLIGKQSSIPYGSLEMHKDDSNFKKILIYLRINLIIPDMRRIWNRYAYKAAKKELISANYNAIITSGPPHSTHLIGYKLKQKFNIKWISDFRDPWTQMGYLKNVKRWKLTSIYDKILERKIIENSDKIIAATKQVQKDFSDIVKADLITNGYDLHDFPKKENSKQSEAININYFGLIPPESSPLPLAKAISKIADDFSKKIFLNLYGNVNNIVKAELQDYDFVRIHDYLSHDKMIPIFSQSTILLLMINNVKDNFGIVPGKIYEYLGAKIPILGIGPENGDAAEILQKTNSGYMFDYDKIEEIKQFLKNFEKDKFRFEFKNVEVYERKNLTKKLAKVLEQ